MYTGASLLQPELAIPLCVQEIYALRARCSIPERLAALPAEERSDLAILWVVARLVPLLLLPHSVKEAHGCVG